MAFALGIFMATSGLVAACSSGGDDGNDEDYVKALCDTSPILDEVLAVALASAFSDEEPDEETVDEMVKVLEKWVDALDDANPPADAADVHNSTVDTLRDSIDQIKSGDSGIDSVFDDDDEALEFPTAVQDRLAAVAENTEACDDLDFFS